jgi:hypothetical protein
MKMKLSLVSFFVICVGVACGAFAGQSESTPVVASDFPEKGMIPNSNMLHIGIVVRDLEAAMEHWAGFLGQGEMPNIILTENNKDNPPRT